jgi:hypothetical protein
MKITGGCYCGQIRYEACGEPMMKAQCHCRECQYITGGSPNVFIAMPANELRITQGQTKSFSRTDIEAAVTREFCPNCGTQILTRAPAIPEVAIIKVGTMDDPSLYEMPQLAIFTCDRQAFHTVPDGVPSFDRLPG